MQQAREDIEAIGHDLWALVVEGVPDVISTPQAAVLVVGEALLVGIEAVGNVADVLAFLDNLRARVSERMGVR